MNHNHSTIAPPTKHQHRQTGETKKLELEITDYLMASACPNIEMF